MSLFIYLHRRPRRVWIEDVCKVFYLLLALMSATFLLVTFVDWVEALGEIFDRFWGSRDAELRPRFDLVLTSCPPRADSLYLGRNFATNITAESRMFIIMTAVNAQSVAFGLTWAAVVLGTFNKFMFRSNWHHFRWRGLIIPTAVILPTIELFLDVLAIVTIVESFGPTDFANRYVESCTAIYESKLGRRPDGSIESMYVTQPFEIELVSLLVIICINVFTMLVAVVYLLVDASDKGVHDWARTVDAESHWKPPYGWEPIDEDDGADTTNPDDPNEHIVPPRRFLRQALKRYPKQIFRGCPADVLTGRRTEGEPSVLEEVLRSATRLGLAQEVMRWMVGAPVSQPPFAPGRSLRPPPPEIPVKRVRVTRQEIQVAPDHVLPKDELTLTIGPGGPDPEGLLRLGLMLGHSGLTRSGFLGRLTDRDETDGKSMRLDRFEDHEKDLEGLLQLCSVLSGDGKELTAADGGTVLPDQIAQVDRSFAYSQTNTKRPHVDLFWIPDPFDPAELEADLPSYGLGPGLPMEPVNAGDVSVGMMSGPLSPALNSDGRPAGKWPSTADVLAAVTNEDV